MATYMPYLSISQAIARRFNAIMQMFLIGENFWDKLQQEPDIDKHHVFTSHVPNSFCYCFKQHKTNILQFLMENAETLKIITSVLLCVIKWVGHS